MIILVIKANMLDKLKNKGWEIKPYSGSDVIFQNEFKEKLIELENILDSFKIPIREIMCEGGGVHPVNKRFSLLLNDIYEKEIQFKSTITTTIGKNEREIGRLEERDSHNLDFFYQGKQKNLGIEVEWNSKVLAFERDIGNFRRLFINSAIHLGIIITKGESLHKKLETICEDFFKKRINTKNWIDSVNSIEKELSNYKDCNDKNLNFKSFTPRQIKNINNMIDKGTKDYKAIAKSYYRDKWGGQTSYINSLVERIERGGFLGIPILCIGIPSGVIDLN
mgnify:CR=1 FL=1